MIFDGGTGLDMRPCAAAFSFFYFWAVPAA
jgi:hypothetical protein